MTEQERVEALKREARELQDELRPLIGRERRGELDFTEEQRAAHCRERLAEIRAEAEEIGAARARRRRERIERERKARDRAEEGLPLRKDRPVQKGARALAKRDAAVRELRKLYPHESLGQLRRRALEEDPEIYEEYRRLTAS